MKREKHFNFFKSLMQSHQIQSDKFFSNDTINRVVPFSQDIDGIYLRIMSHEESRVITPEAFRLMLFWVNSDEISIDFFERFLSILVSFTEQIYYPIDEEALPPMIEMMSLVDFKDHVIYTTIEIYIESPDLLRKQFNIVH